MNQSEVSALPAGCFQACSHGVIATVIYLLQLMGCLELVMLSQWHYVNTCNNEFYATH